MESQIERISAVECRVRVEIPWAEVSPRWEAELRDLRRRANVPGFRRGKVPPRIVERMFGKGVREDLARNLIGETFEAAVAQHSTTALTRPVRESYSFKKGKPFTYAVRFEVPPAIEPKDYEGVAVRRRPAVADPDAVERLIAEKQDELTEVRPIDKDDEREETRAGDVWTVDYEGKIGEQPVSGKDAKVEIGGADEPIPGFAAALEGTKLSEVGSTKELTFTPTPERMRPEHRGLPAVVNVGFRDVREKVKPELDDEFARDTGEADTLAELKSKYEDQVREEDGQHAEREARMRLVQSLLEANAFEVAPSMVAREVQAQVNSNKQRLAQAGLTLAQAGLNEQQLAAQLRPQALFQVKAFLLLDAIGKKHEITVTDEELDAEVKTMAEERNQNFERFRASLESNNQILLLRAQMREERILDFLMDKADVTEAPDPEPEADGDGASETDAGASAD